MIQLPKIHQCANTDDIDATVMLRFEDGSRLVIFALDPAEQFLIRFFYSGSYASYVVGTRPQIAAALEEDLHNIGQVFLEEREVGLPTLKNWGFTTLAKRFKNDRKH